MIGRWRFEYSLIPHEGGWERAFAEAHRFARPLATVRTERGTGSLPPSGSLLEVEPDEIIVSTLKPADDGEGVVVRVYNVADREVEGRLRLNAARSGVERVDLNEELPEPEETDDDWVRLSLRRNEIVTLRFET